MTLGRWPRAFRVARPDHADRNVCGWGSNSRTRQAPQVLWRRTVAEAEGTAKVRLSDGSVHLAEIHWYEATGIDRKEYKIKRLL